VASGIGIPRHIDRKAKRNVLLRRDIQIRNVGCHPRFERIYRVLFSVYQNLPLFSLRRKIRRLQVKRQVRVRTVPKLEGFLDALARVCRDVDVRGVNGDR
jgi:hypothetical protein